MNDVKKLCLIFLCLFCWIGTHAQTNFTDIALSQNIDFVSRFGPSGVSLADFDGDGWDDLTFSTGKGDSILFYRNVNGVFQKVVPSLVTDTGQSAHVMWVDYDNDGNQDLFVTYYTFAGQATNRNKLYRNTGNMNLVDVTLSAGLSSDSLPTLGATWADYDRDGHLDLLILNRDFLRPDILYRNMGNGTFQDVTAASEIGTNALLTFCATFFDYDGDLWPDYYTAEDLCGTQQSVTDSNRLYRNNQNGTFSEVGFVAGADKCLDAMCVNVGDYNNDGHQDIYVTNSTFGGGGQTGSVLLRNNGNSSFTDVANSMQVAFDSSFNWGSNWLDMDNDGDQDLYVAAGQNIFIGKALNRMYENPGNGMAFANVTSSVGMQHDTSANYGSAVGDFNNDGFPDLAVSALGTPVSAYHSPLWLNNGGTNNWIKVKLEGTASNKNGIGSLIEVYAGGNRQVKYTTVVNGFLSQSAQTYLFGLGSIPAVDSIVVSWPSGVVDVIDGGVVTIPTQGVFLVTEGGGCAGAIGLDLGADTTLCAGEQLSLDATILGVIQPQYLWQNSTSSATFTVQTSGVYWSEVSLGNCVVRDSISVAYANPVSPELGNDTTLCTGANLTLDAALVGGTYLWQDNSTNNTFTVTAGGTYFVEATVGNCVGFDTIQVMYTPHIQPELGNDTTICLGNTLLLDASLAGSAYQWQDNSTNSTFLANSAGMYSVTVSVGNCSGQDTILVTNFAVPTVNLGDSMQICPGDSHMLDATNPMAVYLWQDGTSASQLTVKQAGTYRVSVSIGGCTAVTDSMLVQEIPFSIDAGNPQSVCKGSLIRLDADPVVTHMGYSWFADQAYSGGLPLVTTAHYCFKPASSGWYVIHATDRNTGCSGKDSVFVRVREKCKEITYNADCIASTRKQFVSSGISVFPNPTQGIVFYEMWSEHDSQIRWQLLDLYGKKILADAQQLVSGLNRNSISVGQLPAGIYYLEISQGNDRTVIKLIKQ